MTRHGQAVVRIGAIAAAGAALAAGLEVATYPRWRQWCLSWGATDEEVARTLPGDDLLAGPDIVSTRAVRIDAPASSIWPWLVQMGPGRGGAYTYDWIENLFGLGMHSADGILPQFQDLKVGDAQRLGKRGPVLRVSALEPERALVLRSDDGNWIWAFILVPEGTGTRLISRNRIAVPGAWSWSGRCCSASGSGPNGSPPLRIMRHPGVTPGTSQRPVRARAWVPWLSRPGTTAPRSRCAA
jgi:hypothetical protein